ncbi:hypothetical protein ON010_g7841 [Phytophthora cinnamomi]|nr:hypothetical protein ON010_g7841 [Phytophthora cinnamomi]
MVLNVLARNLRQGQDLNQYLIIDIDLFYHLDGLTCSPFGAVAKGSAVLELDARIIHDLSYLQGWSVNDHTVCGDSAEITYEGAPAIAHRVLDLQVSQNDEVQFMTGDVHSAFRRIL